VLRLARLISAASRVSGVVAAGLLMAACIVVCESVFVRYVLQTSTIWQTEFVKYAVVAATLLGSPYVLLLKAHVRVDVLSERMPAPFGNYQRKLADLLALCFCVVLAVSGWRYFHEAWTAGWVSESVWAPRLWIILLPLPVGIGLLCLQYVVDLLDLSEVEPKA
jgi:TRAP-type C4-dicarboxylate transport system permease small subunit